MAAAERLRCPSCGQSLVGPEEVCPRCGADTRVVVLSGAPGPTGGRRPRRSIDRLRPVTTVVGAVALVAALWLVRDRNPPQDRAVTPTPIVTALVPAPVLPTLVGDRMWRCPAGWPYAAYEGFRYYPPNHPRFPEPSRRPVACWASARDATRGGYTEGPDPMGSLQVDGVYLVPTGDLLGNRCSPAAQALGFTVPCPTVLPNRPSGTSPPSCSEGQPGTDPPCVWAGAAFLFQEGGFAVPPDYHVLNPENVPHLFVAAWTDQAAGSIGQSRFDASLVCPDASRTYRFPLLLQFSPDTPIADVYACRTDDDPIRNHTVIRWTVKDVTYEVGVYGFTTTSIRLAQNVASTMAFVEPPG